MSITIDFLSGMSGHYLFLGGSATTGWTFQVVASDDSPVVVLPGVVIITDEQSAYPARYESRRIGDFQQGSDRYGAMRDTEVLHTSIRGNIVFDRLGHGDSFPSTPFIVDFKEAAFGEWAYDLYYPAALWQSETTRHVAYQWKCDGDVGIVSVVALPYSANWSVDTYPFDRKVSFPAEGWATVFRRDPDTGLFSQSAVYDLDVSDPENPVFHFDNQDLHIRNGVHLPDPGAITNFPVNWGHGRLFGAEATDESYDVFVDMVRQIESGDLATELWSYFMAAPLPDDVDTDLTRDIVQQGKYVDANYIADLTDFCDGQNFQTLLDYKRDFGSAVRFLKGKRTKDLLRTLPGIRKCTTWSGFVKMIGGLANASSEQYLRALYGVMPVIRDFDSLKKGVGKLLEYGFPPKSNRLHTRRTTAELAPIGLAVETVHDLTVEVCPFPSSFTKYATDFMTECKNWGVAPRLATSYDLIPFSFVLDWFVDFGGLIKDLDTEVDVQEFDIYYCIRGEKRILRVPASLLWPGADLLGDFIITRYERTIADTLPITSPTLSGGPGLLTHWSEGSALAIGNSHGLPQAVKTWVQRARA